MSESFEELLQQADALIKRAHEIRAKEKPAAIERIKAEIAKYELTVDDLGLSTPTDGKNGKPAPNSTKAAAGTPGKPKYRDPQTGQTWTGHGKAPKWIKDSPDRTAYLMKD